MEVTHNGTIKAEDSGIILKNIRDGKIMVTTGEGSMITTDTNCIEADIQNANASGDLTITHNRVTLLPKPKG